jgi:hypothetical protein
LVDLSISIATKRLIQADATGVGEASAGTSFLKATGSRARAGRFLTRDGVNVQVRAVMVVVDLLVCIYRVLAFAAVVDFGRAKHHHLYQVTRHIGMRTQDWPRRRTTRPSNRGTRRNSPPAHRLGYGWSARNVGTENRLA